MRRLVPALIFLVLCACSDTGPVHKDDWLSKTYADIEDAARGTTVRFYMYGGLPHVNAWIDNYVAPTMKRQHDISVVRVPTNVRAMVDRLVNERNLGRDNGIADLIWINGENFKYLKRSNALFGPIADKLPNFRKYVNKELAAVDFGYPNEGYEVPFGKSQFVFEYDSNRLEAPPRSLSALQEWVKENPGKFTYRRPPDYVGSAFIRQVFYYVSAGSEQFYRGFSGDLFEKYSPEVWQYLKELAPYLWKQGREYPKDGELMDRLFVGGEILLNMTYQPLRVRARVLDGEYPDTVRSYVMKEGSLFNLHFTAVPFNATNKPGALVLANFLMSPAAQYSKLDPINWGDYPAIDVARLPESIRQKFASVYLGKSVVSHHELALTAVPEIPAEYVVALDEGWQEHVAP